MIRHAKNEMVGRAGHEFRHRVNTLRKGAGVSSPIERKQLFRALPAPEQRS
jgi:hypothetical protein